MTLEEHMFLSKYLFDKIVEVKREQRIPLEVYELLQYKFLEVERRKFYESLAHKLITNLKIDFKNHPPF